MMEDADLQDFHEESASPSTIVLLPMVEERSNEVLAYFSIYKRPDETEWLQTIRFINFFI